MSKKETKALKTPVQKTSSAKKSEAPVVEVKQAAVKSEGKAVKNDKKAAAEKAMPAAKESKPTAAKPVKKAAAKPAKQETKQKQPLSVKAAPEVSKVSEKQEKAEVNKAAKATVKKAADQSVKPTKKAAELKADKPVKKAAKSTAAKKEKEVKKTVKKAAAKAVKATPVKKAVKKVDQAKLDQYAALSLAECIDKMKLMQVQYEYEDYYQLLLNEADLKQIEQNIIEGNKIKEGNYEYDQLGYDADLVKVTLAKVAETMDVKAADFKDLKKAINKALKYQMKDDAEVNAAAYLDEFKLAEKLLMVGQRRNINEGSALSELIGADCNVFFKHYFTFAYELLPSWQYNDVKFYENFAYAVLSQFTDLYQSEQLRIQLDVADLYIKHGDYQLGDEMYGYILRDNQIKDYIYYRYASAYKEIDFNKAKSIAYSSLQYVDDRYTYYPNIMEIVNQ